MTIQRPAPHRSLAAAALPLVAALLFAFAAPADAFVDVLGGKSLTARNKADPTKDQLKFTYRDPAILGFGNPTCAGGAASSLQIITSEEVSAPITLPCGNWRGAGTGFSYKGPAGGPGGVSSLRIGFTLLKGTLKGSPYSNDAVSGPVDWIETRLTIGANTYCGRWDTPPTTFKKNQADLVKAKGPTRACEETCGNGVEEGNEECDDGDLQNGDGCDANCTETGCGNGIQTAGEQCDDGDLESGDGCRSDCTLEVCGDGIVDAGEQCDDDNLANGDCCSSTCSFEANGSACSGDLNACTDDACNGAGVCVHTPNDDPCNDSDGCTVNDSCSSGSCSGEYLNPWVNEFDYDDFFGFPNDDRDEFVEIAGPAGLDLSGYKLISVEGAGGQCGTPFFNNAGDAHFIATIPNGTVLPDDTGTGVGFFVACFTSTSSTVVAAGKCDVVFPAPAADSNLKNGDLLNGGTSCPDGILLLDPSNGYLDAVSYEGVVANAGTWGPFFHVNPPYVAERDDGWLAGVSIIKKSSTLMRATGASEWGDPSELGAFICQGQQGLACPSNTRSPGTQNAGQAMACGSPCRAFLDEPAGLLE